MSGAADAATLALLSTPHGVCVNRLGNARFLLEEKPDQAHHWAPLGFIQFAFLPKKMQLTANSSADDLSP
jgi:hypothetical protein